MTPTARVAVLQITLPDGRVFHATAELHDGIERSACFGIELEKWLQFTGQQLRNFVNSARTTMTTQSNIGSLIDEPKTSPLPTQRDKTFEELVAERFQILDQKIESLRAKVVNVEQLFMQEVVRHDKAGEEGTGIKVVVHDFPWTSERGPTLHELIDRIARLKPNQVIVDTAGPAGKLVLQEMRRSGLPAEPLPKAPR